MVTKVAVIGSGQMGLGIAQVAASIAGKNVILFDRSDEALGKAKQKIAASLEKLEAKGRLPQGDASSALAKISFVNSLAATKEADFFIEAIVENESIKCEVFQQLDEIAGAGAIFASNTSSIPITKLGSATKRASQFIGMHFMNPVPLMSLVEVIRSPLTSDQAYGATVALAEAMGKQTVCSQDYPGFIVNRILMPMINEACFTLYEGIATAEDIDQAMKLGTNQPMGPLTLADFIGLDTCLYIMEVMHRDFGDPKFRPCPLLKQYVCAGMLGKKTGRGFYVYDR